jgi:hypothetical protein
MDDIGKFVWRGFSRFVGPRDEDIAVAKPHGGAPAE